MILISRPHHRRFVCYLHFTGMNCIQFGVHLCWISPNIEVHLPFCFIRIGWQGVYYWGETTTRSFGRTYPILDSPVATACTPPSGNIPA